MKYEITVKRRRDGLITRFISGDMTRDVLDMCVVDVFEAGGLCKVTDIREIEDSK